MGGTTLRIVDGPDAVHIRGVAKEELARERWGMAGLVSVAARIWLAAAAAAFVVAAELVRLGCDRIDLAIAGDHGVRDAGPGELVSVAGIEQVNGPVIFLSSLTPTVNEQRPMPWRPISRCPSSCAPPWRGGSAESRTEAGRSRPAASCL